jgi:ubiquinone/menaquinone biosynthesis C-methylase UbiE
MFGEEFFPTPPAVAKRMLKEIKFQYDDAILEPSAGKGDLIEEIKEHCGQPDYLRNYLKQIDAVEIEPNLRAILKEKEIRVVHSDFLTFSTLKRYDYIIMNPPFSAGAEHLTKALDFLKPGGTCVCVLNAETIRNTNTNIRKALVQKLEAWNASFDYVQHAFKKAERKTNVEVVIIQVARPESPDRVSIKLENLIRDELTDEEKSGYDDPQNALVDTDPIRAAINQYRASVKMGIGAIQLIKDLRSISMPKFLRPEEEKSGYYSYLKPLLEMKIKPNEFIQEMRKKYWMALFDNPELIGQLTDSLRSNLCNQFERLKDYDFTLENILALREEIGRKFVRGVQDTILELYDEFTEKHHWCKETSQNIHYFNGWATNKACYVNKKVIIPLRGYDEDFYKRFRLHYGASEKLTDVEKILAFLQGGSTYVTTVPDMLREAELCGQSKEVQLINISVNFYKKGTTHIFFTNLDALRRFNIYCCRKKNRLPPDYGITPYEDLSPEARRVIDSFSAEGEPIPANKPSDIGEKSYRIVCARREELLLEPDRDMPLLGYEQSLPEPPKKLAEDFDSLPLFASGKI